MKRGKWLVKKADDNSTQLDQELVDYSNNLPRYGDIPFHQTPYASGLIASFPLLGALARTVRGMPAAWRMSRFGSGAKGNLNRLHGTTSGGGYIVGTPSRNKALDEIFEQASRQQKERSIYNPVNLITSPYNFLRNANKVGNLAKGFGGPQSSKWNPASWSGMHSYLKGTTPFYLAGMNYVANDTDLESAVQAKVQEEITKAHREAGLKLEDSMSTAQTAGTDAAVEMVRAEAAKEQVRLNKILEQAQLQNVAGAGAGALLGAGVGSALDKERRKKKIKRLAALHGISEQEAAAMVGKESNQDSLIGAGVGGLGGYFLSQAIGDPTNHKANLGIQDYIDKLSDTYNESMAEQSPKLKELNERLQGKLDILAQTYGPGMKAREISRNNFHIPAFVGAGDPEFGRNLLVGLNPMTYWRKFVDKDE